MSEPERLTAGEDFAVDILRSLPGHSAWRIAFGILADVIIEASSTEAILQEGIAALTKDLKATIEENYAFRNSKRQ